MGFIMNNKAILIFLISMLTLALTTVIAMLGFVISRYRKGRRAFLGLCQTLGAIKAGRWMTALHEGIPYRFLYFPGSKNAPPNFLLAIDRPAGGGFKVVPETGFDRVAKKLGIAGEIQTGDESFDQDYYVLTDFPDFAATVLMDPGNRETVRGLFALGFNELNYDGKMLQVKWSPFTVLEDRDTAFINAGVALLSRLSERCFDVAMSMHLPGRSSPWFARVIPFVFPGTILAGGIAAGISGKIHYDPLDDGMILLDSLKYSLPLLLVYLALAVRVLSGRSSSHRILLGLLVLSLVAFPIGGAGLEVLANGAWDRSRTMSHQSLVMKKYSLRNKDSFQYYLLLESWRYQSDPEELSVSSELYEQVVAQETVVETITKPGRFGFEWLLAYRIVNR
jgi:hypothetical protein